MELKQYFIDHILHDKEFVQDIIERYKSVVDQVGERLLSHKREMWGRDTDFMREFYDFIDGNGFVVEVDKERVEEHNEKREHQQHRQAAAEHADAMRLLDFLLLGIQFLRIVLVFFLQLVKLRLNLLHLDLRFAGGDIADRRSQTNSERKNENR